MPEWLCRPEGYRPPADRDRFIDKSILSLVGAIAGVRGGSAPGWVGPKIHPALRLASCFVVILLVSLSRNIYFLAAVGTIELVVIGLLPPRGILRILETSFVASLFAFVIFLPSALWGNWPGVLAVAFKVLLSVAVAALVSSTMVWASISSGLAALRLPDTFILVLDLAVKYISLLGGLVLDMLYALKLRSVGKNRDKSASLGAIAGTAFLKSKDAAVEQYEAMECRGFSGSYRTGARRRLGAADLGFIAAMALLFVFFLAL